MTDTHIRAGRPEDDAALLALDKIAWDASNGFPSLIQPEREHFFEERTAPDRYLVAEHAGRIAGYLRLVPATPLEENSHVLGIFGLAVHPDLRGQGIGEALVRAADDEARRRGARKIMLRVFSTNPGARSLYERCGYRREGLLKDEFLINGDYVDDIIMARHLDA